MCVCVREVHVACDAMARMGVVWPFLLAIRIVLLVLQATRAENTQFSKLFHMASLFRRQGLSVRSGRNLFQKGFWKHKHDADGGSALYIQLCC